MRLTQAGMAGNETKETDMDAKPTLLDLYRQDPIAVREQLERQARAERSADVNAFCARIAERVRCSVEANEPAGQLQSSVG